MSPFEFIGIFSTIFFAAIGVTITARCAWRGATKWTVEAKPDSWPRKPSPSPDAHLGATE